MQKRWGIFLLCLGVILPAKGQDSLFDNYKPRSARVEFIVNERGRAQNPTITENESALPEPTVLQRLAWMTFPVKLAGRKSRVLIEFNTPGNSRRQPPLCRRTRTTAAPYSAIMRLTGRS
jgi:hypothetical protein